MIKPPMFLADISARAMSLLDAEKAHATTVRMLAKGLGPKAHLGDTPRLSTSLAGLSFPNPIGLAAGFDKNAEAPNAMLDVGFGFVEVGAVTPRPQPGNDRPRVFRLREDCAVINRYGFNNEGLEAIAARLAARPRRGIVGVNLGANKDSADRVEDYVAGVKRLEGLVDFYTVNISSPNTPGLRALQDRAALMDLLTRVLAARDGLQKKAPLFLKIAPDLTDADKADIADCARVVKLDALVVSNTTITRSNELRSKHANEKGGYRARRSSRRRRLSCASSMERFTAPCLSSALAAFSPRVTPTKRSSLARASSSFTQRSSIRGRGSSRASCKSCRLFSMQTAFPRSLTQSVRAPARTSPQNCAQCAACRSRASRRATGNRARTPPRARDCRIAAAASKLR